METQSLRDRAEHIIAVEKAITYMKLHLEESLTLDQIASVAGYSSFHFTRIFKHTTGISVRRYLSALRIEAGKTKLLNAPSTTVRLLQHIGFSSVGTFQTRFKSYVGLTPQKFKNLAHTLFRYVQQHKETAFTEEDNGSEGCSVIRCHIQAPAYFQGIVFVGLFPRPIPDERPAAGNVTAFSNSEKVCTIKTSKPGSYYVLAAGIPWSLNPKDYFLLHQSLRAKSPKAIDIKQPSNIEMELNLREALPTDPPIVINLPLLLFERDSVNKKSKLEEF
ncbi:AraC family transcriptional regulator [Paenibacillus lemnae]|uniref:Helix-turn-helix transcriptional regulator n=1 Tax=Paenibacillus lemnae TaxID=1330551 RepID=A0A848M7B2_PAELE|nr:AraC family transcriptional regulator [Paenibacillus lemnae]NMO96101.1 helix-turn-helix transcriptional regulator [Paenibacillus lemnae]